MFEISWGASLPPAVRGLGGWVREGNPAATAGTASAPRLLDRLREVIRHAEPGAERPVVPVHAGSQPGYWPARRVGSSKTLRPCACRIGSRRSTNGARADRDWLRHPDDSASARPPRREHHHDLHTCRQPRRAWREKSVGWGRRHDASLTHELHRRRLAEYLLIARMLQAQSVGAKGQSCEVCYERLELARPRPAAHLAALNHLLLVRHIER
jgi:hypothetical protein